MLEPNETQKMKLGKVEGVISYVETLDPESRQRFLNVLEERARKKPEIVRRKVCRILKVFK